MNKVLVLRVSIEMFKGIFKEMVLCVNINLVCCELCWLYKFFFVFLKGNYFYLLWKGRVLFNF